MTWQNLHQPAPTLFRGRGATTCYWYDLLPTTLAGNGMAGRYQLNRRYNRRLRSQDP